MKTVAASALLATALLGLGCSKESDSGTATPTIAPGAGEQVDIRVEVSTVPEDISADLDAALLDTMERFGVPGAVVTIQDPDLGDWSAAAGEAETASGEAMTTDLQWPIRSITKSFTVTVLLQLVDEGTVSLDDTIDQWVDEIPGGDTITLGQLADMTSGVPDYTGDSFVEDFTADPSAAFTREQLLDYVRDGIPFAPPGTDRRYINSSTVLLGEVTEQVEGREFADVLRDRVLEPLGLDDTAYPTDVDGFTAGHPTGYQPDEEGLSVPPTNFTVFDTAGAMTSTVDDLLVWGAALADGELLEANTQEARLIGSPLSEGPEYDTYASGIGALEGWWGHTGEGFGYTTLVMHDPDSRSTVVILMNISNLEDHPPTVLFRDIATILET